MELDDVYVGDIVVAISSRGNLIEGNVYRVDSVRVGLDNSLITVTIDGIIVPGKFYPERFEKIESVQKIPNIDPDAPVILGAEHPNEVDWFAINKEFSAR